jgi:excisionase family DNA binding protein
MPQNEGLLTAPEAAAYLRVTRKTLRRWENSGLLTPVRIGRNIRYRRDDVDALLTREKSA